MFEKEFNGKNFDSHFTRAYYSHTLQKRKPYPETYSYVINDAGMMEAETLFIDDSFANIEGADKAGLQTKLLLPEERIEMLGLWSFYFFIVNIIIGFYFLFSWLLAFKIILVLLLLAHLFFHAAVHFPYLSFYLFGCFYHRYDKVKYQLVQQVQQNKIDDHFYHGTNVYHNYTQGC